MPSYSNMDATIQKSQIIKVYQPDGATFIDVIKDAPYLQFQDQVSASPSAVQLTLPRRIDAYDGSNMPNSRMTIVLGNVLKWYMFGPALPSTGLLKYQGVIDTILPQIDDSGGETVQITVTPFGSILGDHGIIGPITFGTSGSPGTYVDSGTIFSSFFTTEVDAITGHAYGYPFTLDSTNPATTGNTVSFSFQNQTLLSVLQNTLLLSPANYFFRMNPDKTTTFNQYPLSAPTYTLKIGQHIASIQYALDNVPRKNVIVVTGAGTVQAVAVGSSVAQIGARYYYKSDTRITDTNTAQTLANGLLAFFDQTQIRTKVKIPDYRGDAYAGIGFDIEQFKVGQSVQILDTKAPKIAVLNAPSVWGNFNWGAGPWGATPAQLAIWGLFNWGQTTWGFNVGSVFNQVVPIVAINYYWNYVELELGFRQPSISRAIFNLQSKLSDITLLS